LILFKKIFSIFGLTRIVAPEVLREDQASSVLVLDQAPCHNTALLETKARQHGVTLVKIPKRMTFAACRCVLACSHKAGISG
jgi:hypothetical protein